MPFFICIDKNPLMIFPTKKRIHTELFIDKMAALYKGETWFRVATNEGDQQVGTS